MNKVAPLMLYRCGSANDLMCDKCQDLDEKIARYRQLATRVLDADLAEGLAKLIAEAEAEKAALHPEE